MKHEKSKRSGFLLALLVPLLILIGLTVKPVWAIVAGEEISLLTVPVDPRDLFYGDYVMLRYEIEDVPAEKIAIPLLKELERDSFFGQMTVYGSLSEEGGVFVLEELSATKPRSGLYLTGKMYHYDYMNEQGERMYNVDFGLDRFFVPENTGKELEDLSRQGKLVAMVKVKNGYGILQTIKEAE